VKENTNDIALILNIRKKRKLSEIPPVPAILTPWSYGMLLFWWSSRTRSACCKYSAFVSSTMPKCPTCGKEVYFAERVSSIGKDWHRACLKCAKCKKTLSPGGHAERDGKPYCHIPCYNALFGPKGFGHGGTESHTY